MKRKALSLILALMLIFQSICIPVYSDNSVSHDVVLILDSSGSMDGLAITACKQAAKTFCDRILSAGNGYRIGLVIFESTAAKYDFTNDLSVLNTNIDKMYAHGGTNLHSAVEVAEKMLISSGANNKSIVIMADGLPEHGKHEVNGIYTAADSFVYQQANAVYNLAVTMHDDYDIYTLGFFHSISDSYRAFGVRFLKDLQNKGYFEASDAESLYAAFQEITKVLLVPPMDVNLTNTHVSTYTTKTNNEVTTYDFRHLYKITAKITNTGSANADNTKVKIEPAAGMVLDEGERIEKSLGAVLPGETKEVTWNVRFEHKAAESKYQYSVVAGADNAVGAEKFETIIVPAGISSIEFDDDEKYTFSHSSNNFHDYYAIRPDDHEYLESKLSRSEQTRMFFFPANFGGSCFGLSTVAILSKIGTLKPDLYVAGATSISQFSRPINDINVESLITFYHIMQKTDRYYDSVEDIKDSEDLKKIEKLIKESNVPPLITFKWIEGIKPVGHAIVACGYENTTQWNSPATLDLKTYTKKIDIYDVNSYGSSTDENEYDLYYSSDYTKWTIPAYENGGWGFSIQNVTSNPDDYNPYSLDEYKFVGDEERNKRALLLSNSLTEELIIKNSTGGQSTIGATEISGNLNIWSYYDAMVLSTDTGETYSPQTYRLPEVADYSIEVKNAKSDIAFAMSLPDSTFTVEADSMTTADFKQAGEISMQGIGGEFKLQSVYDEGKYTVPWHTFGVSGRDSSAVSIKLAENGYILAGDNLKNITIEGISNQGTYTQTVSSNLSSLLVSMNEEKGEFEFFADYDNDGNYTNNITDLLRNNGNIFASIWGKIVKVVEDIISGVRGIYNKVVEFFKFIINYIVGIFKK